LKVQEHSAPNNNLHLYQPLWDSVIFIPILRRTLVQAGLVFGRGGRWGVWCLPHHEGGERQLGPVAPSRRHGRLWYILFFLVLVSFFDVLYVTILGIGLVGFVGFAGWFVVLFVGL
jgi:hypothetical protein